MNETTEPQIMEYQKANNLAKELTAKLGKKIEVMYYPQDLGMNGGVMGYKVSTATKILDKFRMQKELLWFNNDKKIHVYYPEDIELARKLAKIIEDYLSKNIKIVKHYSALDVPNLTQKEKTE